MHLKNSKILVEQDKCLVLQPEIVKLVGCSAALLLQQIHYCLASDKFEGTYHQGKKWVYNTYEGWAQDLETLSKTTINRSIRKLKNLGLIEIKHFWAKKGNRTNHYTIDYEKLKQLLPFPDKKGAGPSNPHTPKDKILREEEEASSESTMDTPSIHGGSFLYRTKNSNKENILYGG